MAKPFISLRVYMKPLIPVGREASYINIQKVLERSKRDLLRRLQANLLQTTFSPRAKAALNRAVSVKIKPSSLQVTSSHPAFRPLIEGQRKMQMKWLTKAKVPIPIILDNGKLIFRNATPLSMANGRWWHPGRRPSDYIEKARKQTKDYIRTKLMKELARHMTATLNAARLKVLPKARGNQ
jgi:hypothetical protein